MTGPRYIADPPAAMRTVELDGLSALYHRPSGLTHILAAPAPQIIAALAGSRATRRRFSRASRADFEPEAEDAPAAIAARLAELEAAGLVRKA